jgi:hypothetical protein
LLSVGVYYGDFVYQNRLEHEHVDKNFIYGQGYLKAFELCEKYAVGGEFIGDLKECSIDIFKNFEKIYGQEIVIRKIDNFDISQNCFRVYWMLEENDDEKINEIETYYCELHNLRKKKVGNNEVKRIEIEKEIDKKYDEFKKKLKNIIEKNNKNSRINCRQEI